MDSENNQNNEIETKNENPAEDFMNMIFSEVVITFLIWFLAIGIFIYLVFGFFKKNDSFKRVSLFVKTVDFVVVMLIILTVLGNYYILTKEERNALFTTMTQGLKDKLNNNWTVLTSIIEIAVLYGLLYIFGLPSELNKMPKSISFILTILIILTTISIVVFVFNNFLNVRIVDMIYKGIAVVFEESAKEKELEEEEESRELEPIKKEEVFNITNNLYSYEEAPYVCKALNARLANYDEIEQSYENGGEWCNYGWSEGQMAFFPTQKDTWEKLQANEESKNACGRPGVNGGYMGNPKLKFGVNCFGVKPVAKERELDIMNANKDRVFPKSKHQAEIDRKMQFWKENADKLLTINAHNKDKWSRY